MAHDASDHLSGDDEKRPAGSGDVTVQELTWALIDDQIESGEFQLLESMLLSDDTARDEYLNCVQLHVDLIAHFAEPAAAAAAGKSPVLGFLGGGVPPLDAHTAQQ
jgi:hypothetical protein